MKRRLLNCFFVLGVLYYLGVVFGGLSIFAADSANDPLAVNDSTRFFVEPNTSSEFVFSGGGTKAIPYRFQSEKGVVYSTGHTEFKDGKHRIRLFVPPGYSEIEFASTSQTFGVVGLPAFPKDRRDPFFCIDGAFTWLVQDDRRREDYTKIAANIGISVIRERLSWSEINPEEGTFDWEGRRRNDTIRKMMKANGIKVLEVSHDTPRWVGLGGLDGKSGKLPGDLIKTVEAWEKIADRWAPTWEALEIWNEPDISFSGDLPADQYVPLVRALSFRLRKAGVRVPMVGASLATFNRVWIDTAIQCGLLDVIDGFSFHTYAKTPAVEQMFVGLSELVHAERHDLTFWLTECGRPWRRGVGRPPRDQDIASACDMIMKGVESKASVVDYYYPFVYPYYDERDSNFAMMDRWGSPLRSMGAYAQMIRLLSGADSVDASIETVLTHLDGPPLIRHRLFRQSDELILVLYTGDTVNATSVRFQPLGSDKGKKSVFVAESLTGGPVSIAEDGTLTFQDGLVYLRIKSPDSITTGMKPPEKPTPAGERRRWRNESLETFRKTRPVASPFAVVYRFDDKTVTPQRNGYHLNDAPKEPVPLLLRVYNFDDKVRRLSFKPLDATGKLVLKAGEKKTVDVPAGGFVEQTVLADLADALTEDLRVKIRFQYVPEEFSSENKNRPECPVQLVFTGEPDWNKLLASKPDALRLPVHQKESWRSNIAGHGKLTMNFSPDANSLLDDLKPVWSFEATFGQGDRWVYPVFSVPKEIDLSQYKGILLRARCGKGNTQPRVMLYETRHGCGYITPGSAFIADGEWHVAVIPFDSLEYVAATRPDPNGRLDLDLVRTLSIGGNTREERIFIEVGDCMLYQ